jgi:hypothetical protein
MAVWTVEVRFGLTVEADSELAAIKAAELQLGAVPMLEGTDFELDPWQE